MPGLSLALFTLYNFFPPSSLFFVLQAKYLMFSRFYKRMYLALQWVMKEHDIEIETIF